MAINPVEHHLIQIAIIAALYGAGVTGATQAAATNIVLHRQGAAESRLRSLLDLKNLNPPDRVRSMEGLSCNHQNRRDHLCREIVVIPNVRR